MNRTRRKAIKMARRHGRDIYTARNAFWQAQPPADWTSAPLRESMREIYNRCTGGAGVPQVLYTGGESLNTILHTDEFNPQRGYVVTSDGIEPM